MKALLFIIALIACINCKSQNYSDTIATSEGGEMEYLPFKSGLYYLPMASKISIYSRPDARSKVFYQTKGYQDSLRFIEKLDSFPSKYKNIYGYWCKVAFPLKGKYYIGYVPSQFIARTRIQDGNITYIVNLESFHADSFTCALKILNNYSLVSEYRFAPVANYSNPKFERDTIGKEYSGYFGTILCNNQGLKEVDRILYIYSGYPACGYWNGSKILFIKNNRVLHSTEDGGAVDGAEYAAGVNFIFPSDSLGIQDSVIKKVFVYEIQNDSLDITEESSVKYFWSGKEMIKTDSTYKKTMGVPYNSE